MKLNNRGFAISSIMYIILVLAVILVSLILVTLSSRKLILDKLRSEVLATINDAPNITYRQTIKELKNETIAYMSSNSLEKHSIKVEDLGSSIDSEVLSKYKLNDKYLTAVQNTDSYNVYLGKANTISNTTELPKNAIDVVDYKIYGNSVQEGENLFDIETMSERIYGYIPNETNWSYANDSYSIRVPVSPNTTYKVSIENSVTIFRVGCIEHEDIPTSSNTTVNIVNGIRQANNEPITINTTENTKYLVIQSEASKMGTTLKTLKVAQIIPTLDSPIEVESVGEYDETTGKYKIPVMTRGKNIARPNGRNFTTYGIILTTNEDGTVTVTGSATSTTEIVLNWCGRKDGSNYWHDFIVYPNQYISVSIRNAETGEIAPFKTATQWKGVETGKIYYGTGYMQADEPVYFSRVYTQKTLNEGENIYEGTWKVQVEFGSEITSWEPYVEPINTNIYLDEPLRKIDSYVDYVDFKNNKIVRNVKEIIFSGNENWVRQGGATLENTYLFQYIDDTSVAALKSNLCLSTHFVKSTSIWSKDINGCAVYPSTVGLYIRLRVLNSIATLAPDLKQWLAEKYSNGTPVKFYYVLLEEKVETIQLPRININLGATQISIDTDIEPSSYEFTVIEKIVEI